MSHLWPGFPCAGFIPSAVATSSVLNKAGTEFAGGVTVKLCEVVPLCAVVAATGCFATGEFKGAPTGISHLWPGCPCDGFIPLATFAGATVVVVTC